MARAFAQDGVGGVRAGLLDDVMQADSRFVIIVSTTRKH